MKISCSLAAICIAVALVGSKEVKAQRAFITGPIAETIQSSNSSAASDPSPFGILNNSVANLHAFSGSIWVGPYLNHSSDSGATWFIPQTDSLFGTINRLFSIDIEENVIVAGIGKNDTSGGQSVQTASGFLVSENFGETFSYRFPQLDNPDDDSQVYGVSVLDALPVIVPQQSPPFDVDYDAHTQTIWVAGWASGVRKSVDFGRTWNRVVLPPDILDFISPEIPYTFSVEPQRGSTGSLNHMGFSVLVDKQGLIWAGTAGGLNRSTNGGTAWQRFKTDGSSRSITGNWIISLEEQTTTVPSTIWAASWNTGSSGGAAGQYGVSIIRDGGALIEQTLLGEKVYDFAFDGNRVYVAGDNGLFISDNAGRSWDSISQFKDTNSGQIVRPHAAVFSVESDAGALWVGTSDGLLFSEDRGTTWSLFRVNVPLHPDKPSNAVPDVDTFAYPNPFSKGEDVFVRIKFESNASTTAHVNIFDFGMNVVRSFSRSATEGDNEITWDGSNNDGVSVPNAVYFYEVRLGNQVNRGKILVIE